MFFSQCRGIPSLTGRVPLNMGESLSLPPQIGWGVNKTAWHWRLGHKSWIWLLPGPLSLGPVPLEPWAFRWKPIYPWSHGDGETTKWERDFHVASSLSARPQMGCLSLPNPAHLSKSSGNFSPWPSNCPSWNQVGAEINHHVKPCSVCRFVSQISVLILSH